MLFTSRVSHGSWVAVWGNFGLAALLSLFFAGCPSGGGGGGGGGDSSSSSSTSASSTSSSTGGTTACTRSSTAVVNDPLYAYQWYLNNTAQTAFASTAGTCAEDINWAVVTQTGAGVTVAVVDEGLEIGHEDLSPNVSVAAGATSCDFTGTHSSSSCTDTNPTNIATDGDHGTSVGGLIAAKRNNGIGLTGVAGDAKLVGFNFLQSNVTGDQVIGLGGATYSNGVSVFNQSYGFTNDLPIPMTDPSVSSLISQVKAATCGTGGTCNGTSALRGGKGAIYVKSAGNGFSAFGESATTGGCDVSVSKGLTCQNANMDPANALPYQIIVGAVNAAGMKSSYSTAGSAIWVSAPGGEYGYNTDQGWLTTNPPSTFMPAMISTDQTSCLAGYSRSGLSPASPNSFQDGDPALNANCNYTSTFNGTSSAAPVTSGVVALLLEANPNLTWRDVKHLLAATAKQVDASRAAVSLTLGNGSYVAEPAWTTNSAGYHFHNWYGFGRVDAGAAATMAATYTAGSFGTQLTETVTCPAGGVSVPNNSITGGSKSCSATSAIAFIEAVQVTVNISSTWWGALGIEVTSPKGTRSVLLNGENGFYVSGTGSMTLETNAFYGESLAGGSQTWTIKVIDADSIVDTHTLNSASIVIYGH